MGLAVRQLTVRGVVVKVSCSRVVTRTTPCSEGEMGERGVWSSSWYLTVNDQGDSILN